MHSLRHKLFLSYALLVLGVLAGGSWSIYHFVVLGRAVRLIMANNYRSVLDAQNMKETLERQDSAMTFHIAGLPPPEGPVPGPPRPEPAGDAAGPAPGGAAGRGGDAGDRRPLHGAAHPRAGLLLQPLAAPGRAPAPPHRSGEADRRRGPGAA